MYVHLGTPWYIYIYTYGLAIIECTYTFPFNYWRQMVYEVSGTDHWAGITWPRLYQTRVEQIFNVCIYTYIYIKIYASVALN